MHEDHKPGDLSVRLSFGRVYGTGSDRGQVKPGIEITCQTSGKKLTIELTPEDLAEMLAGGAAEIPTDRVNGFQGVHDWGKDHVLVTRKVKTEADDYKLRYGAHGQPRQLPHVAKVIAEIEADGYKAADPRRDNTGHWVIIGRKYEARP